jgi:hypothetical protein
MIEEAKQDWNVYFILPKLTCYYDDNQVAQFWKKHLGENFVKLDKPNSICEKIAALIGINEGIDVAKIKDDIKSVGGDVSVTDNLPIRKSDAALAVSAPKATGKNVLATF